ncbi:MAG: branched-chain amino acid ABC transporter permease [Desulfosalsimonadaceae bacterium]
MKNFNPVFLAIFIFLVVIGFIVPAWMRYLLTIALCKGIIASGVILLLKGGLVSFGHAFYSSAGAYAVALTVKHFGIREIFVLIPAGIAAGVITAAVIGLIVARYREIFFAMITMAFSMAFYGFLVKAYDLTGGTDGMRIPSPTLFGAALPEGFERLTLYFVTLVLVAAVALVLYRIEHSPFGYLLQSIKGNEVRVSYLGIAVQRSVYRTFIISGVFAGLGGALLAVNSGHIDPHLSYWTVSGEFVFISLLSGVGNLNFVFIGAVLVEFIRSYAFAYAPYLWQMILGGIMLLIIIFSPGGVWQIYKAGADKVKGLIK